MAQREIGPGLPTMTIACSKCAPRGARRSAAVAPACQFYGSPSEMKKPTRTQSMTREMWGLEIYRQQGNTDALVATHDFHSIISLLIAIIENRSRSFVVREPAHATPQLDLSQGFDIKISSQG